METHHRLTSLPKAVADAYLSAETPKPQPKPQPRSKTAVRLDKNPPGAWGPRFAEEAYLYEDEHGVEQFAKLRFGVQNLDTTPPDQVVWVDAHKQPDPSCPILGCRPIRMYDSHQNPPPFVGYEHPRGKTFCVGRRVLNADGKWIGWRPRLDDDNPRKDLIYRLPVVLEERNKGVWWFEGEKDALAGAGLGLVATSHHGQGNTKPDNARWLVGSPWVVIVRDNDPVGARKAWATYESLIAVGFTPNQLRIVEPADDLKDFSDHLLAGYLLDDLIQVNPARAQREARAAKPKDYRRYGYPTGARSQ